MEPLSASNQPSTGPAVPLQAVPLKARDILLVDDHPIVRSGLRQLIDKEIDLNVCGEAGDSASAWRELDRQRPKLILLDIALQGTNGIELTKSIREAYPDVSVLILSMHDESLYAERALRAGAAGYIMKQEAPHTVLQAIRRVLDGQMFISEAIASRLLRTLVTHGPTEPTRSSIDMLSDRELEIFELIGNAWTTKSIAERLNLSVKTVETHKANIKRKLKLRTAMELNRHAIRWVEEEHIS